MLYNPERMFGGGKTDLTSEETAENKDGFEGTFEIRDKDGNVLVDTDDLKSIDTVTYENGDKTIYGVAIELSEYGAGVFYNATMEDVGYQFPVYVNGVCVASPTVTEAIKDGKLQISGIDSMLEAYEIVSAVKNGTEIEGIEDAQNTGSVANTLSNDNAAKVLPDGFEKATKSELSSLPETEELLEVIKAGLLEYGAGDVKSTTYGNYDHVSKIYYIDAYIETDTQKLLVVCDNLGGKWSVTYIKDTESTDEEDATVPQEETTQEDPADAMEREIKSAVRSAVGSSNTEEVSYNADTEYVLIKIKGEENISSKLTVEGMLKDIYDILEGLDGTEPLSVDINVIYPMKDKYGNTKDETVIKASYSNDTRSKLDFDGLVWLNIGDAADDWWMHPSCESALDD